MTVLTHKQRQAILKLKQKHNTKEGRLTEYFDKDTLTRLRWVRYLYEKGHYES